MSVNYDFDQDAESVYELLTDPQFLVDRCIALDELSAECDIEEHGEEIVISLTREVQRDLPKVLAKLFDPVQVMDMTERWQSDGEGRSGDWNIDVRGQPVTISAKFKLAATAGGCRYSVSHRVKANIPLVGGRVEKYVLGQTGDGARAELDYLGDYLETKRSD
jgi:hypothetical protein